MTDPITDMLNRIRNAQAVSLETVDMPFSNLKYEIAKILKKNDLIQDLEKRGRRPKKSLRIVLKYDDKKPGILGLKRVSRPGQRLYTPYKKIKRVKGGYGIAVISTPKGLMTDREARKQKLGGEVFFEVW